MLLFYEGVRGGERVRVCGMAKKKGGPPGLLAGNHGRKMVLTNWFPEGKWSRLPTHFYNGIPLV
jgi:hypothetical protein